MLGHRPHLLRVTRHEISIKQSRRYYISRERLK